MQNVQGTGSQRLSPATNMLPRSVLPALAVRALNKRSTQGFDLIRECGAGTCHAQISGSLAPLGHSGEAVDYFHGRVYMRVGLDQDIGRRENRKQLYLCQCFVSPFETPHACLRHAYEPIMAIRLVSHNVLVDKLRVSTCRQK